MKLSGIKALIRVASLAYSILGIYLVSICGSVEYALIVFTSASLIVLASHVERDFSNPVALFVTFYYAYSTWFCYYALISGGYDHDFLVESIRLASIGLAGLVLGSLLLLPRRARTELLHVDAWTPLSPGFVITVRTLSLAGGVVVMAASTEAMLSGHLTKRDLLDATTSLRTAAGYASVLLAAGVLLSMSVLSIPRYRKKLLPIVVFGLVVLATSFLALGERDHLFRVVIGLLILFYMSRKTASILHYLALLVGVAFVLPFTQEAKGLFLSISGREWSVGFDRIFGGEFLSAGRNTYMMLLHGVDFRATVLVEEVARGLLPFSGEMGFQSAGAWYDQIYRVEHGFSGTSGWGFSLVALGYMAGGGLTVLLVFIVVGLMLTSLHKLRNKSPYWMVFYILALSSAIYCIRADLANLLSQVVKVGGTALLMYAISPALLRLLTHNQKRVQSSAI